MTEQQKTKIYDEALEEWPNAPQKLRDAYSHLIEALEDYVVEVQKDAFCYGYEEGRRAGAKV